MCSGEKIRANLNFTNASLTSTDDPMSDRLSI